MATTPAKPKLTAAYRLLQWQYRAIYQAGELAVRAWLRQGTPLDDPIAMFADHWLVDRPRLTLREVQRHHQLELGRAEALRAAAKAALSKEVVCLPGPLIAGQPSFATVAIKRNRATAVVRWSAADLERDEPVALAFVQRLLEAGMPAAVQGWLEANASPARYQDQSCMSVRSGGTGGVALDRASSLAELIASFYRAALADLPPSDGFERSRS